MSCHSSSSCGCSSTAVLEKDGSRIPRICLVGNPNAGKSTLFNALTGMRAKVANYPGVTVSRFLGNAKVGANTVLLEDLPGTYSLDPISPDEQVVLDSLSADDKPDAVVAVLDATSLRRSLGLLAQLQHVDIPVLVVLSFADELARRGGSVDVAALSTALGHDVVIATAGNKNELAAVRQQLGAIDTWSMPDLRAPLNPELTPAWIDSILREAHYVAPAGSTTTRSVDNVLLHPVWGSIIFFAVMFAFFQVIFTVAEPIKGWLEAGCGALADLARDSISIDWLQGLVADGLIGGVGGVLSFLPQITLLFLMISLMEASGYLSRAAFLMDRVMGKFGLEGRAFVSMLSSVACAIPGIMSTRSLPSARDRLATMMSAPLMTCSARLPVYTMLIAMMVPEKSFGPIGLQGSVLFGMYLFGTIVTMLAAAVFKRLFSRNAVSMPFFLEMPNYRMPKWRDVWSGIWIPVKGFLTKVGKIIVVLTVILWAMLNLPMVSPAQLEQAGINPSDEAAVATYQLDQSVAADIGKAVQPVFEPLGFDWRVTVGVLASLGAREVFVSTLGQISSAEDPEDPASALAEMTWSDDSAHAGEKVFTAGTTAALLIFFAFAMQCTSTIAVLKRESGGWKWPAIAFGYMFALAWIGAFLARTITNLLV